MESMTEGAATFQALAKLGKADTKEDLEKIFKEIDADGNGTLDVEEVQAAMKKIGNEMSKEEVIKLFESVKDDKAESKEEVTLEEFVQIMTKK